MLIMNKNKHTVNTPKNIKNVIYPEKIVRSIFEFIEPFFIMFDIVKSIEVVPENQLFILFHKSFEYCLFK